MSAIAIALLLALGGAGIGHRLVPARTAAGLRLPLALALGFLVIGALTLALGLADVLRSPLTPALLVLAAGFGLALGAARLSRPVFVRPSPAALAIAVIVTALLLLSLAPTTFYDSLLYHLGSPVAWLIEGRIAYEPGVFQTGLPCAAEVLYTPALRLGAMAAAQALNVLVGVALLLAVAGAAGGASAPPRASALAALTLAASPMFLMLAYLPKSDLLAALFGLLAMAVLWEDDGDEALAGFLAAAAATAKTTAAVVLAPTLAVLLLTRPKRPRRVGLALAGAALALTPWAARHAVATARGEESGAYNLTATAWQVMRADGATRESAAERFAGVARLPLEMFHGGAGSAGVPGALFLLATALGALAARRDRVCRLALLSGLAVIATRAALTAMPRYALAGYAALAVAGGRGFADLLAAPFPRRRDRVLRVITGCGFAALALAGVAQAGLTIAGLFRPQLVLFGAMSREDYLTAALPSHLAVAYTNAHFPRDGGRLLVVGEVRRAYLEVPHTVADEYHPNPLHLALATSPSTAAARAALERQGFTWVLWNPAEEAHLLGKGASGMTPRPGAVERFLKAEAELLADDGKASVWRLHRDQPPARSASPTRAEPVPRLEPHE